MKPSRTPLAWKDPTLWHADMDRIQSVIEAATRRR